MGKPFYSNRNSNSPPGDQLPGKRQSYINHTGPDGTTRTRVENDNALEGGGGAGVRGSVSTLNNRDTSPHSSPDPHTPNSIPHIPPQAQRQRNVNGKPASPIRNPSIGK